jgi:glycerate dehydrogenase
LQETKYRRTNIPKYATVTVAEYLLFLALCLAKKLPLQLKNNNRQDFSPQYLQKNLDGKTAGIIGGHLAKLCKNLNMKVIYWSRSSRDEKYEYVDLEYLFENADFIFCTLLISDETKKLITDDLINKMKPTSSFISGSGTSLHNHKLIIEKIEKSEIYGYALEEPNRNLFDYPGNIMVTSEYAWFAAESTELRMDIWIDSIEGISKGQPVNAVG